MKRLLPLTLALVLALSACAPSGPPTADTPVPSETASPPTQTPAPAGPLVYTDYSQLTPYEKPQTVSKFTRRYPEFTDHLIPADDYGPLIPFPGAVVTRSTESRLGIWMEDYNLYGLMTLDGEVIVDPVFSSAFSPSLWDEPNQRQQKLDCLILQKVVRDENGEPMSVAAVCARDGSWCTGFDYFYDWELMMDSDNKEVILLRRIGDGSRLPFYQDLVFLDARTGEELKTIDLSPVLERWPDVAWSLTYHLRNGERYALFSDNTKRYLFDTEAGTVQALEETLGVVVTNSSAFSEGLCPVKTASGWGYIDGSGRWVIDPVYEQAGAFENGRALVVDQKTGYYAYIDRSGEVLFTFPDCDSPSRFGEFISYESRGRRYFLDKDLKRVPLPDDFTNAFKQGDWFIQELPDPSPTVPGGWAFWNCKTEVRQDFSNEWDYSNVVAADKAILNGYADRQSFALADLNTGEVTPLGHWASVYFSQDSLTGETLMWLEGMGGAPSEWRNLQGDTLYTTDAVLVWGFSFWGDRVLYAVGDAPTTLTNWKTGELLFSWPLHSAAD